VIKAGEGVATLIGHGVLPSGLEIIDNVCIQAVNKAMNMDLPDVEALLLIEADGKASVVEDKIEQIAMILKPLAKNIEFTGDEKCCVYGKVERVYCRPSQDMEMIWYQ
jgi:glycolate oxidase